MHVRAHPPPLPHDKPHLLQPGAGEEDDLVVFLMSLHDSQGNRRIVPYVRTQSDTLALIPATEGRGVDWLL